MKVEVWDKQHGLVKSLSWEENGKRYEIPLRFPMPEDNELKELMVDLSDYIYLNEKLDKFLMLQAKKEIITKNNDYVYYEIYSKKVKIKPEVVESIMKEYSGETVVSKQIKDIIRFHYPKGKEQYISELACTYLKYMADNDMAKKIRRGRYKILYDYESVYSDIHKYQKEDMNVMRDVL